MTKIAFVGDLHGCTDEALHVIDEVGKRKISHLFALGDFGWWNSLDGVQYIDAIQKAAKNANLLVWVVPGNHDSYDLLEAHLSYGPRHKGGVYIRSNLIAFPKVNTFRMFNKTFGIAGGAVSVDRKWREEYNHGRYYDAARGRYIRIKDPTKIWWEQEQLTDDEVIEACNFGKIDYLLTHDASDHTPWKRRLKPDWESQAHRQKIDKIIEATNPEVHFGGHFHEYYDWSNTINGGHYVRHITLEADYLAMHRAHVSSNASNWGVLETNDNTWAVRGEGMHFRSLEESNES